MLHTVDGIQKPSLASSSVPAAPDQRSGRARGAGWLPSVEQCLPPQPLVVKPTNIVGKYGGTLRGAALATDLFNRVGISRPAQRLDEYAYQLCGSAR
jgi:hypothetical protein